MNYIINTPEFTKALDAWLWKSKQTDADFLFRNKEKIPQVFRNFPRPVHRGMIVESESLQKFPMTLTGHTSWSKDVSVATKFAKDIRAVHADRKMVNPIGILVSKTIMPSSIIIDIDGFVSFMGLPQLEMFGYDETNLDSAIKEKEVLVAKTVKISKTDIKKVFEF